VAFIADSFMAMKAAACFAVLLCFIATTSSQPTYDSIQQQVCDDNCRPQDDKLEILQRHISVMKDEIAQLQQLKNDIAQLKNQVDNFLSAFGGTTPRSASKHTVIDNFY